MVCLLDWGSFQSVPIAAMHSILCDISHGALEAHAFSLYIVGTRSMYISAAGFSIGFSAYTNRVTSLVKANIEFFPDVVKFNQIFTHGSIAARAFTCWKLRFVSRCDPLLQDVAASFNFIF